MAVVVVVVCGGGVVVGVEMLWRNSSEIQLYVEEKRNSGTKIVFEKYFSCPEASHINYFPYVVVVVVVVVVGGMILNKKQQVNTNKQNQNKALKTV